MSNDSKLITVYIPKDKAEHLVIEALLDSFGIETNSLNVINLILYDVYGPSDNRNKLFQNILNAIRSDKKLSLL